MTPSPTAGRPDGRALDALRPITLTLGAQSGPAGSALIRWGGTHVLCAASVEDRVPHHRLGSGGGWLTAEYDMLPGAGNTRVRRSRDKLGGRTAEIQRLIGRSLRAAVDLDRLGAHTLWIDCDVLDADGGTRCASITGAYVAVCLAIQKIARADHKKPAYPRPVAAVSVGLHQGRALLDLCYAEDSAAEVDLNFVATEDGIVEIQGTAEGRPFTRAELDAMLTLADKGCAELFALQRQTLAALGIEP
ncbi:MAG: ribonuclease PH [Myxococcales bacterium]|nr:ribonuclease PH [Myxococcales bacterium]